MTASWTMLALAPAAALLAAANGPERDSAIEWVPVPAEHQDAPTCRLSTAWRVGVPSGLIQPDIEAFEFRGGGKVAWNGIPVDDATLRQYLAAHAKRSARRTLVLYGRGADCARLQRVASIVETALACTPRECVVDFSEPPRRYPSPPAPPPPPSAAARDRSRGPTPATDRRAWVTNDDYPPAALRAEVDGGIGYSLEVSETGAVRGCTVTDTSRWQLLDDATCNLLRTRAKLLPALDSLGRPIAGRIRGRLRWSLAQSPMGSDLQSGARIVRMSIGADDRILACTIERLGTRSPQPARACEAGEMLSRMLLRDLRGAAKGPFGLIHFVEQRVEGMSADLPFQAPAEFMVSARARVSFTVTEAGEAVECRLEDYEGTPGKLDHLCDDAREFDPPQGANAQPVRRKVSLAEGYLTSSTILSVPPPAALPAPDIRPWTPLPPRVRPGASGAASPPKPLTSPQNWVRDADYPASALRADESGLVGVALNVDETGAVRGCTITFSSTSPTLDARTCALVIERARFHPALDRKGKPVASVFHSRFRWVLPPYVNPLESSIAASRVKYRVDGTIESCTVEWRRAAKLDGPKPCEEANMPPPYMFETLRWTAPGEAFEVVFFTEHRVEGAAPVERFSTPPGFSPIMKATIAFDITEAGTIENCRKVLEEGLPGMSTKMCASPPRYRAGEPPARHRAWMTVGFLTSGRPPAPAPAMIAPPPAPSDAS